MPLALEALARWLEILLRLSGALGLLVAVSLLAREAFDALTRGSRSPLGLRLAGTGVGAAWILTAAFHVLGALHAFGLGAAAGLALAGLAVGLRPGATGRISLARDVRAARRWAFWVLRRRPVLLVVPFVVLLLGLRALLLPPIAWDTLTYHLVKAALWVQTGGAALFDAPGGWSAYRSLPGGGEVLWAWAMLPFGNDLFVGLADVAAWVGLAASIVLLCREIGLRGGQAWLVAAFVASTPAALLAAGSAYVDNLGHAFAALGVAFTLRFLRRRQAAWLVHAGAAFGLAAGVKITALPFLALPVAAAALAGVADARARARLGRAAAFGLVLGMAACLPWSIRNAIETGHPFSPFAVRLGGLTLGENAASSWYRQQPVGQPYALADEWRAFAGMLHTPLKNSLGGFPALPLVLAPVGLLAWWRRDRPAAALGLVLLLHSAALYLSPQFSTTRLGWAENNGRYFLLAIALATAAGFMALEGRARAYAAFLLAGTAFDLWVYGALGWGAHEVSLVLGHGVLLVALVALGARLAPREGPRRWALALALAAAFATHAALWRDASRYRLMAESTSVHPVFKYWLDAARAVDDPREGYRIALTSGPYVKADNWFAYPFLGSRLQNSLAYVPPSRSGLLLEAIDPRYLAEADRSAWLDRLRRERVDAVMSFAPAGPELGWMENDPGRFARAAGDGWTWGLYVVRQKG